MLQNNPASNLIPMTNTYTPYQQEAIKHNGGNICVAAGAGSGKTGVLVERMVRLIVDSKTGVLKGAEKSDVDEFLVITFTEKATKEMKSRLVEQLNGRGLVAERRAVETAYISTIHGFCSRLLQENPFEAGIDPQFTVLDESQAKRLRRLVFEEVIAAAYEQSDENITELISLAQAAHLTDEQNTDALTALAQATERVLNRVRGVGRTLSEVELTLLKGEDETARLRMEPVQALLAPAWNEVISCVEALASLRLHLLGTTKMAMEAVFEQVNAAKEQDTNVVQKLAALREAYHAAQKAKVRGATPAEQEIMRCFQRMRIACEEVQTLFVFDTAREEEAARVCHRMWHLMTTFWKAYAQAKRQRGVLDTDDLPAEAVRLLEKCPGVRGRYCRHFRYLMVDEFQDTDPLQMRLLRLLHVPADKAAERGLPANTLFVVGDVQQSIYSFRNAEPALFQTLERRYRQHKVGLHIPLAVNFRSRPEVLRVIEHVFGQVWRDTPTPFVPLTAGAGFDAKPEPCLELLLTQDLTRKDYVRLEADALAARIQQMVQDKELRLTSQRNRRRGEPIAYRDVAILLRSLWDVQKYEEAFARRGVPCFVVGGGRGYYARHEIRDLINVLTVIETPLDEVALAAVLRSPFVGTDADTLLHLARYTQEDKTALNNQRGNRLPLYAALHRLLETDDLPLTERQRLRAFIFTIEELRLMEDRLPVGHLLERLITRTQYDARLLCRPGGRRRLANVRKLLQMANAEPVMGARDFIRRLKELEQLSDREGEAPTEEEASDVVRILTIHGAKGLEFPVVVLADMGRNLIHQEKAAFLCDPHKLALGTRLGSEPDLTYRALLQQRQTVEQEEYARLLYVAMTRAQEHLILCGDVGRSKGLTWASQLFPLLGVLAVPDEPVNQTLSGGLLARVAPLAYSLHRGNGEASLRPSRQAEALRRAEQIAEAIVTNTPLSL